MCAALTEWLHDLKTGGSDVKGLLISNCAENILFYLELTILHSDTNET